LTTSAPSVIARMIFEAGLSKGDRVLEIGTGTGYQAAVLAEMGVKVYTIEIERSLVETASRTLISLGYKIDKASRQGLQRYQQIARDFPQRAPIEQYWGDGRDGLPARAPYNGIILAASLAHLSQIAHLAAQLSKSGGRLVAPIGDRLEQVLHIVERRGNRLLYRSLEGICFQFVRMVVGGQQSGAHSGPWRTAGNIDLTSG
jgi:protein-L-isoaspartate(D-aspartate) O-methyltransferase